MATITEDYCSFEVAKLLKEKGFEGYSIITIYDKDAANAYVKELQEKHLPYSSDDPKFKEFYYTQPTLQMAMKWLREVHNIHINICYDSTYSRHYKFYCCLGIKGKSDARRYDTYEQAAEAAIKYCLENLI